MTATLAPETAAGTEDAAPKSRKKLLLIGVLVVAIVAGAGWFFVLRPSGPAEPKPGEVLALDAIQINLADGHYLRLGLALQLTESAHEVDGSKALDAAIALFSGLPVSEVTKASKREKLREQLDETLHERYHGDVMEVYFTEFVSQ